MADDYHISDIYQGGYSSLSPNYGPVFTGYRVGVSQLGLSTDPRTANILKEVSDKIAPGEKIIELSLISPETLEAVPKQHLDEVKRISKLTGVDITVHGPLVDASGVSQQGFNEQQREIAERKIFNALERSHEINPEGNIPVTFHTANALPGTRYTKKGEDEYKDVMPVVNQETGQITAVKRDVVYHPLMFDKKGEPIPLERGRLFTVEQKLEAMNHTEWDNSLAQIEFNRESAERIMREIDPIFINQYVGWQTGEINPKSFSPEVFEQVKRVFSADEYVKQAGLKLQSAFEMAYKFGTEDEKKVLKELSKQYQKALGVDGDKKNKYNQFNPKAQSQAIFGLVRGLDSGFRPQIYKSAEEYAIDKSVETFGNAAWQSYKKFGESAPIMNIENPPAGFGLSRAEDLKNLVEKSKRKFEENAVKNGMSESDAKKQSEKLIGVTWDVGHINQLRQFGFSGKDIIGEAGKVAHLVKHVHLSDNFGMENTELPMGMGNVDLKEVMEKLGKKGEDARKIVEAAHWWQFQQTSPIGVSMEALGSPIYGMKMAPYWNQSSGFQQGYFGGYGAFLPQGNYETFGSGFSQLPVELGGQRQGAGRSRMGGTPME